MQTNFILGNIFSLVAAICLAISVFKKTTKSLLLWQSVEVVFCILSNIALVTYSALTTNSLALVRDILAYKNKLTETATFLLLVGCIIFGLMANNRGFVGVFPMMASLVYTLFLYAFRNEQQIRFALIINLMLWFVHDFYVGAYPSAVMDVSLSAWTLFNILKNMKIKKPL
ncbi:MAG: YgjV family protein [Alphaproteobacteria bacterium]|nr:YgjV family protein [Alphaproteobacteria bacterium]